MPKSNRSLALALAAVASIVCAPALARTVHCYTFGAAQTIVPDLFDTNPNARKLGLTVENVTLGGEIPDDPGTCYIEITTNTGLVLKYKFRYDGATGEATIDAMGNAQSPSAPLKDCSAVPPAKRTLDCAP